LLPRLEELIDASSLQGLFDAFYTATGIAASVISLKGKILVGSGWQKICTDFHRKYPESEKLCIQSDIKVREDLLNRNGHVIYKCPHGLIDAAIPLFINGQHAANLFTGQFLFAVPDENTTEVFRKQALKWGFPPDAYIEKLAAVPIIPEQRIKPVLSYLKRVAEMIGEIGFSRLKLEESREATVNAHTKLSEEVAGREEETRKLTQILEGNPIPTFVIDADCKITHWNRACELLTNIPASEVVGTDKHREAFYSHRRELMADLIVRQVSTSDLSMIYGEKFKVSRKTIQGYEGEDFFPKLGQDGKWLFFNAAPLKDVGGTILGAIETIQDITHRRTAELGLRASELRYRQLFESANDAIFILKDGLIVDCNKKALDLFNSSRKEIIGLSPIELSTEAQFDGSLSKDEIERRNTLVLQNVPQFFEWRFLRKEGSQFDAEVSLTRFTIEEAHRGLAIIRDITARKKMIQALEERQAALDEKSNYLEKVNQALKSSLDHREVEKRAVEENMLVNLKRFVFPYLEELEKCSLGSDARAYLNIIGTNLNDIVSQFSKTIFSKYIDFTPTEVRIADFIREGKNSKEIANTLALSPSSIQWHRKNIRQKLGLTNKKVNLHTYLNSLIA